ncbi:MAG: cupin domain-containing protein [Gemmatimonadetes bacterium]|nr:cupin domain-containing protein [Gemmatimonadota bacterium]
MIRRHRRASRVRLTRIALITGGLVIALPIAAQTPDYAKSTEGTRWLETGSGLAIKVLVEAANLGSGEVEVAEITFPVGAGATSGGHRHGAIEIFYILSGRLDHVVNGESHVLEAGGVGMVRPGDEVIHRALGDAPVRAIVIWAPGGEVDRIARSMRQRPIRTP